MGLTPPGIENLEACANAAAIMDARWIVAISRQGVDGG